MTCRKLRHSVVGRQEWYMHEKGKQCYKKVTQYVYLKVNQDSKQLKVSRIWSYFRKTAAMCRKQKQSRYW